MTPQPTALDAQKQELRRHLRAARRHLPVAQRQAEQAHVCRILATRLESVVVASYAALPDELSIDDLHVPWWAAGRSVWLPRVIAPGELAWHPVTSADQLASGAHGIREPQESLVPSAPLPADATILVPGVGFTADGWRLGQGGGFYDRLLATHRGPTIGIAFACQRLASIPRGTHDRPVGEVLFGG